MALAPGDVIDDNRLMDQQTTAPEADAPPLAPRLTLRRVVRDAVKHFFDLENGWMRTVRDLTLVPGPMISRYVQGHRKVYANPFAYLVLATAVGIVFQNIFGFQDRLLANARAGNMESPLQMEFVNRFTELVFQNTLYLSIGVLVPMAILTRLFFSDRVTTSRSALSLPFTRVDIPRCSAPP